MSASTCRQVPQRTIGAAADEEPERPLPQDYIGRVRELHELSRARNELEELVDALTATLAWVVFNLNRPEVTGDVLIKLGRHIEGFAARERAMRELEEMRVRGGLPS